MAGRGLDQRAWEPDASCSPFFWNSARSFTDGVQLGQFRVPPGLIAVLTSYYFISANGFDKSVARVALTQDVNADGAGLCYNGAVGDVRELGVDGNAYAGFAILFAGGPRPCRILLEPGLWFLVGRGTTTGAIVMMALTGHLFPSPAR